VAKSIFIVGSGLVGQATGKGLAAKGFNVTFIDIDPAVVSRLRREGYRAFEVYELQKPDADVLMVSVPTYPLNRAENGLDFIKAASTSIGSWLSRITKYCLVVVRSTVLPGTTEEVVMPILEEYSGKTAGRDFGICVNPDYLRELCAEEDFLNPWSVVIGELDKNSGDLLQEVYYWVSCPIYRMSVKEAEIQKFVHNLFNATKISFFNEMRLACHQIGLDGEEIFPVVAQSSEACWNPHYGTRDLGPFGGSCLPKDVVAFLSWAKEQDIETPLIQAVLKVNEAVKKRLEPTVSKVSRS
jgi:UDPglucose 6-dehydrogenase